MIAQQDLATLHQIVARKLPVVAVRTRNGHIEIVLERTVRVQAPLYDVLMVLIGAGAAPLPQAAWPPPDTQAAPPPATQAPPPPPPPMSPDARIQKLFGTPPVVPATPAPDPSAPVYLHRDGRLLTYSDWDDTDSGFTWTTQRREAIRFESADDAQAFLRADDAQAFLRRNAGRLPSGLDVTV